MQLRALQESMQRRLGEWGERVHHLRLVPRRERPPDVEPLATPGDSGVSDSRRGRLMSKLPGGPPFRIPLPALGAFRSRALGMTRIAGEDRVVQVRVVGDRLHARPLAVARDRTAQSAASGSRRGRGLPVTYALSEISCSHERLELPAIEEHLLPTVIEQRAGGGQFAGGEMEIAWVPVKTTPNLRDLLVVTIDRRAADHAVAKLRKDGYRVQRIVTPAVALAGLLRSFSKEPGKYTTQAIVHLGERVGSVGFVVDDELALGREFPLFVDEGVELGDSPHGPAVEGASDESAGALAGRVGPFETGDDLVTAIVEEISRSLMLLNHRFQGRKIERILLASDCHPIERLRQNCQGRFNVPAELILETADIDTSAFGEGEIAQRRAAAWALPIASAAVDLGGAPQINLLPARIRQFRALRRLILGASYGLLALALGMSIAHTRSVRQTVVLKDKLEEAVRYLELNRFQMNGLEELYVGRMQAATRHEHLVARQESLLLLQSTLGHLSKIIPEYVSIERLDFGQLHRDDPAMTMRIQGDVRSRYVSDVQAQFNDFVAGLRQRPELSALTIQPVQIETLPGESQSRLTFDIIIPFPQAGGHHDAQD